MCIPIIARIGGPAHLHQARVLLPEAGRLEIGSHVFHRGHHAHLGGASSPSPAFERAPRDAGVKRDGQVLRAGAVAARRG